MQPIDPTRSRFAPPRPGAEARQVGLAGAPLTQMPAAQSRARIMVVDDMSVSRGVIAQSLEVLGCKRVQVAGDARSALAKLQADPVDLVLSDHLMPGMTGLELLYRIRKSPDLSLLRFVLVTGAQEPGLERQAAALGVSAILWKPYSLRDLRAMIERVMTRSVPAARGGIRSTG